MKASENMKNRLTMAEEMKNESTFQILEYDNLQGAIDLNTALQINLMKEASIKLKQVRIILDDSAIKIEAGSLSYMKGNIDIINKPSRKKGFGKKFFSSKSNGELIFKPILRGTGEVFLESSFGYFTLIELEDEEVIIDDTLFYACEESVEIKSVINKNISSTKVARDELCEIKLSGSGIVVLEIPVPEKEILRCKLYKDILKIDGNFAILRSGNIEFSLEKSGTNHIGTSVNGESLLNFYRGTGEVWLVPTESIYINLKKNGLNTLNNIEKEFINDKIL